MSYLRTNVGLMAHRVLDFCDRLGLSSFVGDTTRLSRGLQLAGLDDTHLHTLDQVLVRLEKTSNEAPWIPLRNFRQLDEALQALLVRQGEWLANDPYSRMDTLEDPGDWAIMGTRLTSLAQGMDSGEDGVGGALHVYESPLCTHFDPQRVESALAHLDLCWSPQRLTYREAYRAIEMEDTLFTTSWLDWLESQRGSFPSHPNYQVVEVVREVEGVVKLAKVCLPDTGQEYYWYPARLMTFANTAARKALILSAYDEYSETHTFPRAHCAVLGNEVGVLREVAPGKEPLGLSDEELTRGWPDIVAVNYEVGNIDVITPNLVLDEAEGVLRVVDPDYILAPALIQYTSAKLAGTHLPETYSPDFVAKRLARSEEEATDQIRAKMGHWMSENELRYLLLRRRIVRADLASQHAT